MQKSGLPFLFRRLPAQLRYLAAVPLVWLLLGALPVVPFTLGTGIDASWNYALNIAHAKGVPFGTHLFFTMGPLGYLATPDPAYTGMVVVLAFIAATYLLLVYGTLRYANFAGTGLATVAAFVLLTQSLFAQHFPDIWQAAYMSLFLATAASLNRGPVFAELALSGLVAGFTLLFKVNEGITSCAIFACLLAYSVYRSRRLLAAHVVVAILPVFVLLVGLQILQGDWTAAFPYLRNSLDVMGGFSRAASMPGPVWQSALAIVSPLLLFGAAIGLGGRATWLAPGFIPAMIVAFTAFKHGMVRQDGHADMVEVKIAIAALFLMTACAGPLSQRVIGGLALSGAVFTICIVARHQPALYSAGISRIQPAGILASIGTLSTFDRHWELRAAAIEKNLRPLRLDERFRQIAANATVDAFPENIDVIRASGLNYRPRPGIQSSGAFTPRLDGINAEYLEKGPASEYALFIWFAIDGRHPFFQDPRTLLALFNHYDVAYSNEQALLLKRRSIKKFRDPEPIGASDVVWNQVVAVPALAPGETLLAKIDIPTSLWGRMRAFLFRASPVYVQVNYRIGQQGFDRVVTQSLAGNTILSPLPHTLPELVAFLEGRPSDDAVVNIEWISPGLLEYGNTIHMSWYRMRAADSAQPVMAQNIH